MFFVSLQSECWRIMPYPPLPYPLYTIISLLFFMFSYLSIHCSSKIKLLLFYYNWKTRTFSFLGCSSFSCLTASKFKQSKILCSCILKLNCAIYFQGIGIFGNFPTILTLINFWSRFNKQSLLYSFYAAKHFRELYSLNFVL